MLQQRYMDDGKHKYMKRCSTPLAIREMQTKTAISYHFIPIRIAILKKTTDVGEDVEKREPLYIVGGNVNWCSYYEKQYGRSSNN